MAKPFQLGKGLSSLIPQRKSEDKDKNFWGGASQPIAPVLPATHSVASGDRIEQINLGLIKPNEHQPRQYFDHEALEDLVSSIKVHGIIQPLVVSRSPEGAYNLIVGERRLRAAEIAGLKTVPAIVRESTEQEKLELALIENIQRQDLNPLEEAEAYGRLQNEFGLTQEAIAKQVGKSRPQVANTLRLLSLPVEIQLALREGKITFGHAKVILSLPTKEEQEKLFSSITREGLPVHLAESKARAINVKSHVRKLATKDADVQQVEHELQASLGTKVKTRGSKNKGVLEIAYYSWEELVALVDRIIKR